MEVSSDLRSLLRTILAHLHNRKWLQESSSSAASETLGFMSGHHSPISLRLDFVSLDFPIALKPDLLCRSVSFSQSRGPSKMPTTPEIVTINQCVPQSPGNSQNYALMQDANLGSEGQDPIHPHFGSQFGQPSPHGFG